MVSKEPLLKDCPELITHLGAERPVLGKYLKAVFDQSRGHIGQHLDDCPQIKASGIGTLDSLQFAEEKVGTGLGVDPFHCLSDRDAFLPIVVTVYEEAEEKDPCFYPPLMDHEPQGSQRRTKYPIIIRKGMLQNIVDGELRRIEESFLRNPGLIPRQVFGVHDRISSHLEDEGITPCRSVGRIPHGAAPPTTSMPDTRGWSCRDTPWDRRVRSRSRPSGNPDPSGTG